MGEVFAGRYELVDPIGRGGVGAVWRAWDHRRRRYVAAKVLQQSDAHALLRFVREQALRIDHPHVLAPASWAADDDKVLFTMDLVAGGSLVHLVNDYGPLPPAFVCVLTDQLLAGLAAVHAEGVVHRDIKPANVLLEATGTGRPRLRLSDFGIAMRLGEPRLTETNYVVGTPGYFAPEQMLGSEPDFPADLFAVGLVALYLLEGSKPDAKALIEYFAEHGTPSAPRGIPEPLWQVLAMLLQPDPHARFRTATGARKALAAAVELLPEPGPDDELIEVFDQLGPLPEGFGPTGPSGRGTVSPGGPRTLSSQGLPDTTEAAGSRYDADDSGRSTLLPASTSATGPEEASRSAYGSEPKVPQRSGELREREQDVSGGALAGPGAGTGTGTGTGTGHRGLGTGTGGVLEDGSTGTERGSGQWPSEDGRPTPAGPAEAGVESDQEHIRPPAATDGIGAEPGSPAAQARPASGGVPPRPASDDAQARSTPGDVPAQPASEGVRAHPTPADPPAQPASGRVQPRPGSDGVQAPPTPGDIQGQPASGRVRHRRAFDDVQPRPGAQDDRSPAAPEDTPRDPVPGISPRPPSMSDTGSFHLPPPRPAAPADPRRQPRTGPSDDRSPHLRTRHFQESRPDRQTPTPPAAIPLPPSSAPFSPPPFDPTPTPTPPTAPLPVYASSPHRSPVPPAAMPQHTYAPTASYTARSVQVPPGTTARPEHRRRHTRPRPGPPATVAVPMLLLALACFAVGFWALSQV
ncbi:protein kinase [Streptomyces sp. NPDC058122]|uniref:serine/threonine-protein kinase n=1 Tax=Streptomyces sp. NPDC058122 TaxID=3346349 RepID=UPI0036F0E36F